MRFATYWCPPQPSTRLGAGSPGGWAAPAPGTGAQRGLGSGSEQPGDRSCLPCLSLSTGEETRPRRWGAKNASATKKKKTRSNKCQPEGKRPKKKEKKEKIGGKRSEKPGHSLTHRKNSIALGDRSQVRQGTAGAASAGMGQSMEHPQRLHCSQPSSEVLGPGELGTCPNGSFSKKGNEDEGKAGEGAAEPPPAAVLAGLTGHGCVLCPPCGHSIPPRST